MRQLHKLSAKFVANVKAPNYYSDGGNLYLQVGQSGSKSWLFIYKRRGTGTTPEMGLGSLNNLPLKDAREKAAGLRQLLYQGIDPLEARNTDAIETALDKARSVTFNSAAKLCIAAKRPDWKNAKHAAQWTNTLATYAAPFIGEMGVQQIDTASILAVLEPVWNSKPETAARLRARMEAVLDWAKARDYRHGENPARWRGHLDSLLPTLKKKQRVKHHAALPYDDVPAFMRQLRQQKGTGAEALQFTILTAARTGEVLGAGVQEFDLKIGLWTIPASRMKAGIEHSVPLAPPAIELVRAQPKGPYLFAGLKPGHPMSNMAMAKVLKRMNRGDITVHGFRSSFRDWAAEKTAYQNFIVEKALAHVVGNAVEAAYRRGELLEKRRALMMDWAQFATGVRTKLKSKK